MHHTARPGSAPGMPVPPSQQQQVSGVGGGSVDGMPQGVMVQGSAQHMQFLQQQQQQQQQQSGIPMHQPQPRHVMVMPGMPSSRSSNGAVVMQAPSRGHTPQRFPSHSVSGQGIPDQEAHLSAENFPPGAATIRLLQYSEALGLGPDRQTLEYWKSFVDEFYMPNGTFHYVLWNPSSREQKGFEIPTSVLPRWLLTNYISGIKSGNLSLENPREYIAGVVPFPPASPHFPTGALGTSTAKFIANLTPSAAVTHLVETTRATFFTTFENGWHVQQFGSLRCTFVPYGRLVGPSALGPDGMAMVAGPARLETKLRLESFDYSCVAHNSWLPLSLLQNVKVEQRVPPNVVAAIVAAHSASTHAQPAKTTTAQAKKTPRKLTSAAARREKEEKERGEAQNDEESKEEGEAFTFTIDKIQNLPESPVNEYGITLRAMRCLEITESVCHLRDLMDFAAREKLGPIEGLRKLAAQYRTGPNGQTNGTTAGAGQSPSVRGGSGDSAVAGATGGAADATVTGSTEDTSPDVVVQDGPSTSVETASAGTKRKGGPGGGRGGKAVQQSPRVGANKRQK